MSKVCEQCGKKTTSGHNVSHAVNRTKRTFKPNLIRKRIWDPLKKAFSRKRICAKCLKTINKNAVK